MARPSDHVHPDGGLDGSREVRRRDARRRHLERSWRRECDIDPMILRARRLRREGSLCQAASVEEELLPPF